ncbi:MAG: hypothetical protein Q9M50_08205 [Methylococcales bacterium]|nr:hypothetical protein [Methylococcales bacterium]
MTETPSSNALIYAILALKSETDLQKEFIESTEISNEEREEEQEILDDVEQAFMEFIDLYKKRCKTDSELPAIDELLTSEL